MTMQLISWLRLFINWLQELSAVSGAHYSHQCKASKAYGREYEEAAVRQMMAYSFIGGQEQVMKGLNTFIDQTCIDELMVVGHIYDPEDRIKSYQLLAEWM